MNQAQIEDSAPPSRTSASRASARDLSVSQSPVDDEPVSSSPTDENPSSNKAALKKPYSWLLVAGGLFFVGIGAIGAILPGVPTAVPLVIASILLTKSNPRLEKKLVRSRFFAPFHQYLDGPLFKSFKSRVIAFSLMWISIIISTAMLWYAGTTQWILTAIIVAGLIGSVVIFTTGKQSHPER